MPYATTEQVTERYGADLILRLTDRDGDGAADAEVLERALADAASEIDTYLAAKYQLPLSETPAVLTRLAVDIAVYRLAVRSRPADRGAPPALRRRHIPAQADRQGRGVAGARVAGGAEPVVDAIAAAAVQPGDDVRAGRRSADGVRMSAVIQENRKTRCKAAGGARRR